MNWCRSILWEDGRNILPRRRARHLQQTVSDKLPQHLLDAAPWLTPPPLDAAATREGLDTRFQFRVMLAWFTAQGPHMLPKGALRLALATHLQLPLVPETAGCGYQGRHHEAPCRQILGKRAHQVHACGQRPRQAQHNKLRDSWAALLRHARWHVQLEQLVPTTEGLHREQTWSLFPQQAWRRPWTFISRLRPGPLILRDLSFTEFLWQKLCTITPLPIASCQATSASSQSPMLPHCLSCM